jgi:hypothetical protein
MATRLTLDFETATGSSIFGIAAPYCRVNTPSNKMSSTQAGVPTYKAMQDQIGMGSGVVLAGLEVTAKSVERTAEATGADIASHEQREIRKAVQLDLPVIVGKPVPILYVQNGGRAYRW